MGRIVGYKQFNEAYLHSAVVAGLLDKVGAAGAERIGSGDNGEAFLHDGRVVKITTDSSEAEFAAAIMGKRMTHVANTHAIYMHDTGSGEDNRDKDVVIGSRYYWVIVRDYLPYRYYSHVYYDALMFFDKYQEVDGFKYDDESFMRMRDEFVEGMDESEAWDADEIIQMFMRLHRELRQCGILTVADMKTSNMGMTEDGEIAYLELHVYKTLGGFAEPEYETI